MSEKKLNTDALHKAYHGFEKTMNERAALERNFYETYRTAVIKHFEVCFELSWKFMQRWFQQYDPVMLEGGYSKKDIFRISRQAGLIEDVSPWFDFLHVRNMSTHSYDGEVADEMFDTALIFFVTYKIFIDCLEKKLCME